VVDAHRAGGAVVEDDLKSRLLLMICWLIAIENIYDNTHSESEDRFLLLGLSSHLRLVMVCHCYREDESVIRIISARKATAKEAKYYRR
jgi:uncharacterized DUF497 family protein